VVTSDKDGTEINSQTVSLDAIYYLFQTLGWSAPGCIFSKPRAITQSARPT